MTDAQHLFDLARKQFNDIADDVERHFDLVAGQLREWIPTDKAFPSLQPPTPKRLPPPSTLQLAQRWISSHRALTAAAVAFLITGSVGGYIYVRSRQNRRRRRARKSPSGARTEVVVIAGAVADPVTAALYLDLERRGFVVYVVASTQEDERYIRSQSRADLLPLHLDLVDPYTAQQQIGRFKSLLEREHRAFDTAEPHTLKFVGLVLVPDTRASAARIEDISSEEWSDGLNAKVLGTIATTQMFLPSIVEHKAKVLMLAPSVTPSLRPAGHAVESTVYGALDGFVGTLAAEMREEGVVVSQFKLGSFEIQAVSAKQRREGQVTSRLKATPVRRLQDAVFDALVQKGGRRTWHVGRGSLAYDVVGSWVPAGVVGWMMGGGRRKEGRAVEVVDLASSAGSLTWEKVEQDG